MKKLKSLCLLSLGGIALLVLRYAFKHEIVD